MAKIVKVQKSKPSKLKTGLKIAGAAVAAAGAYGLAKKYLGKKGGVSGRRSKKSAQWYAKNIMRLKLKKRYDKLRLSI